jgi:hypothetical protein
MRSHVQGTIYLLHFTQPYKRARNTGPRTCQPAWPCTPRAAARGWSRSSWPRASGSSWRAPGRGIGSWSGRSSAAGWRRATAPSAASSAASTVEPGGRQEGGHTGPPLPLPRGWPVLATAKPGASGHSPTTGVGGGDRPARFAAVRGPRPPPAAPHGPADSSGRSPLSRPFCRVQAGRNSSTGSFRHGAACGGSSIGSENNPLRNSVLAACTRPGRDVRPSVPQAGGTSDHPLDSSLTSP